MKDQFSRRHFTKLAIGAAIVGFNPDERSWITQDNTARPFDHLPKLDGWAAIRELQSRAETAAIPVIVLTGHDFKAYLKPAALAAGVVSYLMKPCFPEQLAREVGACLTAPQNRASRAL